MTKEASAEWHLRLLIVVLSAILGRDDGRACIRVALRKSAEHSAAGSDLYVAHIHPCELRCVDAGHRVLERELIDGHRPRQPGRDPQASRLARGRSRDRRTDNHRS